MKITTIPGFADLTPQQAFDLSLNHLRSTRVQSMDTDAGTCSYGGTGCAAAPFLTADTREALIGTYDNAKSWHRLRNVFDLPDTNANLIFEMQGVHDSAPSSGDFMEHVEDGYEGVAARYNLAYKPEATQPGERVM